MIANTIISAALRKLMVVPTGGTPSAAMYTVGLELLNDMLRQWSAEGNLVYEETREDIVINSGDQSFTIGASGDKVTARPIQITQALLKDANNIEYRLRLADKHQYASFSDKSVTGLPGWLYYLKTFPNGTLYFERTTDKAYTLVLTSIKALTEFPDGTTEISLPDHYEKALKDNLTVEIAPEMGAAKRVTPLMLKTAERSLSTIIGEATNLNESRTELSQPSVYNIEGDTY